MASGAEELKRLKAKRLTPLGRRILARQALLDATGDVGAAALARSLGVTELTIQRLLKEPEPGWFDTSKYADLAASLCRLLRVDRSWMFDVILYGDQRPLSFDLKKRKQL